MEIKTQFNIGDIVYLKHDFEQKPRMIISLKINPYDQNYELACGIDVSYHYDIELSKEKDILI